MRKLSPAGCILFLLLFTIGCTSVGGTSKTEHDITANTSEPSDASPLEEEFTVLSEATFTGQEGTVNTATLIYDGDVRLSVHQSHAVIDSDGSDEILNQNQNDSEFSQASYSLHTLGPEPLFAVVYDFPTVRGPGTRLDLFAYSDQQIQHVFSSMDMKCSLEAIDYDKGEATIGLPFANTTVTYELTSEERANTEEVLLELAENDVKVDEDFIKSMREDGIACSPLKTVFQDADNDGIEEIYIASNIRTLGARTPVRVYTDAEFVFEIADRVVQLKDVTFEAVKS